MRIEELLEFYDDTSPEDIERYGKLLINKTFEDVLNDFFEEEDEEYEVLRERFNNPRGKGSLGELIEQYHFGYIPNSSPDPDFPKAGVELKVTPFEEKVKGGFRAGERLVIGMIPNQSPVPDTFEESHAYKKLLNVLLVLYLRDKNIKDRIKHPIKYVQLFNLASKALSEDYEIIKSDFEIIKVKIKEGRAHELSEADTMYLGAATKGSTAKSSLQPQYYNPDVKAKRRAFSLKQGYMSSVLNNYIAEGVSTYDSITESNVDTKTFEEIVYQRLMRYKEIPVDSLANEFSLNSKSKDILALLVYRMLDLKTDGAEEFEKSNTILKTIKLESKGNIRENMSFPAMNFEEFAQEEWEDSQVYKYFSENRFLFVIFQEYGTDLYLEDAIFWHMPLNDLDTTGYQEWKKIQDEIVSGVKFEIKQHKDGKNVVYNSLPKKSESEIFHIRPHATKSAYHIVSEDFAEEPYIKGNIQRDADKLPNGDYMTKQSFWLNNDYVIKQIQGNKHQNRS